MGIKGASLLIFLCCCCFPPAVLAQTGELTSRVYSARDGFDEGIVQVIQDRRGFIWLATFSGIYKFDGYKFTHYTHNPSFANSLTSNKVSALWEDPQGRIWIGHEEGLDIFDPNTEKYSYPFPDSLKGSSDQFLSVTRFRERKDGSLLVCTTAGVFLADPTTLLIKRVIGFPGQPYSDIAEAADGSLWTISLHPAEGLRHVDGRSGKVSRFLIDPKHPDSDGNEGRSIMIDHKNRIWLGTTEGLYTFDPEHKSFSLHLSVSDILEIRENAEGKLWLCTAGGFYWFDSDTGALEKVNSGNPDLVYSALMDNQGSLWIGGETELRQLYPGGKKFRDYSGLSSVAAITEDADGNLWMAVRHDSTSRDNIVKLNVNSSEFTMVSTNYADQYRRGIHLTSIFVDREESVWLTHHEGILEKFDPHETTSSYIQPIPSDIIAMHIDSNEELWLGGWNWLGKWDQDSLQVTVRIACGTVHTFLEDEHKNLWIGTSTGLIRYDLKTGTYDILKNDPGDPLSLSGNTVFHLMTDKRGFLWIGTDEGINQLIAGTENETPRFRRWTNPGSGSPNNQVYCIVDGNDGTLWMAWGNVISRLYVSSGKFQNYDFHDGLSGKNLRGAFYLSAKGVRSSTGHIYFALSNGLISFHPDSLNHNTFVPPVVITGFYIDDRLSPVEGSGADTVKWVTPLKRSILDTREITLPYDQNNFSFEFAALNFIVPEKNHYRFRLEPYEKEWVETTATKRLARYTNMSPGKYTFRVIGSNNEGVWNDQGVTLAIVITPPWWQTWWAYILYAVALSGIFLYWRSHEVKRVMLKHRAEQLSELDTLKTRFFTNISHEFRTPVTLILGPLKELYAKANDTDQKNLLATMIRNGQRLLRLINQLMDLSKLEAGKMKLQTEFVDLVRLLRESASAYETLAADKKIKFSFYSEKLFLPSFVDRDKIEKVLHNLLSNAFKFTHEGDEVILKLNTQGNRAVIRVVDTGIGIPPGQVDKIFDRFYQVDSSQTRQHEGSGLGMALAKELVELHQGRIAVESREGKGTTFTVWLPLNKPTGKDFVATSEARGRNVPSRGELIPLNHTHATEYGHEATATPAQQSVLLIVEDNADMRYFIRRNLAGAYRIIEAADGKKGLREAMENVPDLIISDIMMPEMDGYQLCEHIKTNELTSHIPVILLTAKADRESRLTGLEAQADDYLAKPFDADELILIVRNRIRERQKMRDRFSREVTLEPRKIAITSLDEKFLGTVLRSIESHMDDENFTIDELSREAGYSNMQLYRKIKGLTGQTPSQLLRSIRLKRAAEMLRAKSDNVAQIAYAVGFNNLPYFNKCFKEQFGVTPGRFAGSDRKLEG